MVDRCIHGFEQIARNRRQSRKWVRLVMKSDSDCELLKNVGRSKGGVYDVRFLLLPSLLNEGSRLFLCPPSDRTDCIGPTPGMTSNESRRKA
jgi:hypothetical protein